MGILKTLFLSVWPLAIALVCSGCAREGASLIEKGRGLLEPIHPENHEEDKHAARLFVHLPKDVDLDDPDSLVDFVGSLFGANSDLTVDEKCQLIDELAPSSPLYLTALCAFASHLGDAAPLFGMQWVNSVGPERQLEVASSFVEAWAESSPAEAAEWARTHPHPGRCLAAAIRVWANNDPVASGTYLATLPGPGWEIPLTSYIEELATVDPGAAILASTAVPEPLLRASLASTIATDWLRHDPSGITDWLGSHPLPQELYDIVGTVYSDFEARRSPLD